VWEGGRQQDVFPVDVSWCAAGPVGGEKTSTGEGLDPGTMGVWPRAMATWPSGHGLRLLVGRQARWVGCGPRDAGCLPNMDML
jgi:hypothetical protein